MRKIAKLCLACLLALLCLISCGDVKETGAETTAPALTTPETTAVCTHEHMVTRTTETTCRYDGFVLDECLDCGYRVETVIPSRHAYVTATDPTTDLPVYECSLCGIRGYLVEPGESLELSGRFGGEAAFTAVSAKGESRVSLFVDGEEVSFADAGEEATELVAEELADDVHVMILKNEGENDVLFEAKDMEDKLYRRGALLVELVPLAGKKYSSVNVYIQTSDPSGDYYVRYKMQYEVNDRRDNYNSDSGTNRELYRTKTAQLVKVLEVTDTAVVAEDIFEVLQAGELSLAGKETNPDRTRLTEGALEVIGDKTLAADFVGGFHGDERMRAVALLADGEEISLGARTVGEVIPCTYATFRETTTVYAWGTSTESSYGHEMLEHAQLFTFDANGVHNRQTLTWLDDGYELDRFYMHMFTMRRVYAGQAVCETVEILDADGNSLGKETYPIQPAGDSYTLENLDTRTVRYSSATSGVSAETGIRILDESVAPHYIAIKVRSRENQGDNKLYVSMHSAKNGNAPEKGEVFALEVYYHIDYTAPN